MVADIYHDPGHSVPIALVHYENGQKVTMLAPEGLQVDQTIHVGPRLSIYPGNILPVGDIPEGTPVFNIEARPGDGGKFVRAAGGSATIVSHGKRTTIQLPSGQFKPFQDGCRATIGMAAGGGRRERPFVKAGTRARSLRSKSKKYPRVSGVAMNSVNHPHGGGGHQHVGRPSTVSRNAPPGQKVGRLSPKKRKGKRKGKKKK